MQMGAPHEHTPNCKRKHMQMHMLPAQHMGLLAAGGSQLPAPAAAGRDPLH